MKFLRKYEYASVDKDAHEIGLTAAGEKAAIGELADKLQTDVAEFFADVIAKCLARDPKARFPDAASMRRALKPFC